MGVDRVRVFNNVILCFSVFDIKYIYLYVSCTRATHELAHMMTSICASVPVANKVTAQLAGGLNIPAVDRNVHLLFQ